MDAARTTDRDIRSYESSSAPQRSESSIRFEQWASGNRISATSSSSSSLSSTSSTNHNQNNYGHPPAYSYSSLGENNNNNNKDNMSSSSKSSPAGSPNIRPALSSSPSSLLTSAMRSQTASHQTSTSSSVVFSNPTPRGLVASSTPAPTSSYGQQQPASHSSYQHSSSFSSSAPSNTAIGENSLNLDALSTSQFTTPYSLRHSSPNSYSFHGSGSGIGISGGGGGGGNSVPASTSSYTPDSNSSTPSLSSLTARGRLEEARSVSAYGAASTILANHREMQSRVRALEVEKSEAAQAVSSLRAVFESRKRDIIKDQNANELLSTKALVDVRGMSDAARRDIEILDTKMSSMDDQNRAYQRSIVTQKMTVTSLQDDIAHLNSTICFHDDRNCKLRNEVSEMDFKCRQREKQIDDLALEYKTHYTALFDNISQLEKKIATTNRSVDRAKQKKDAMHRYMELIVQINEDLCKTLHSREQSKNRILLLAGKYTPPRYSWPKKIKYPNFQDIVDVVTDAATASALEDSTNRNALRAEAAVKAFSPDKIKRASKLQQTATEVKKKTRMKDRATANNISDHEVAKEKQAAISAKRLEKLLAKSKINSMISMGNEKTVVDILKRSSWQGKEDFIPRTLLDEGESRAEYAYNKNMNKKLQSSSSSSINSGSSNNNKSNGSARVVSSSENKSTKAAESKRKPISRGNVRGTSPPSYTRDGMSGVYSKKEEIQKNIHGKMTFGSYLEHCAAEAVAAAVTSPVVAAMRKNIEDAQIERAERAGASLDTLRFDRGSPSPSRRSPNRHGRPSSSRGDYSENNNNYNSSNSNNSSPYSIHSQKNSSPEHISQSIFNISLTSDD